MHQYRYHHHLSHHYHYQLCHFEQYPHSIKKNQTLPTYLALSHSSRFTLTYLTLPQLIQLYPTYHISHSTPPIQLYPNLSRSTPSIQLYPTYLTILHPLPHPSHSTQSNIQTRTRTKIKNTNKNYEHPHRLH